MKIGIDMGHTLSGAGTGANGIVSETAKNREVGKRLIAMLQEKGHTVVNCTVDSSSNDLYARVQKANAQSLDLFVSLHLNAYQRTSAEMGVETYIYNGSYSGKEANRKTAQAIQTQLVSLVGWKDRKVKEANFYVLRETKAPAVLVELGFCDSQGDMNKWNTEKIASALFKAVTGSSYTSSTPAPTPSPNPSTTGYTVKITADVLNVRKGPGTNNPITTTVKKNEVYTIVEEYSGWGKLKSGAGWISLQYTDKKSNVSVSTPAPAPAPSCDKEIKRYAENGRCTITTPSGVIFRNKPCTCHGVVQGTYNYRESVNYDLVVITEKYVWISWVSASQGVRRYMPIKDKQTNERWGNCV